MIGREPRTKAYLHFSVLVALIGMFSLSACIKVSLLNPDGKKGAESIDPELRPLSNNPLGRPLPATGIVSGGGVTTGEGMKVIVTIGQPVSGSGDAIQKSGEFQVIPGLQGSFFRRRNK